LGPVRLLLPAQSRGGPAPAGAHPPSRSASSSLLDPTTSHGRAAIGAIEESACRRKVARKAGVILGSIDWREMAVVRRTAQVSPRK